MTTFNVSGRGSVGISAVILLLLLVLVLSKQTKLNRGMMGIGALILLIAVILVAAVAASVLISTSGSLQQKALITGSETTHGISPGVDVVSINGADPSSSGTPHTLTRLYMLSRLPAGADALSFNKTVMKLDTTLATQDILYGGTVAGGVMASGTSTYVITYIKSGPYKENDYLNRGDMIDIKFNIDGQLGENMRGRVTIIPQSGNINQLEFVTPETMVEPMVVLWPTT